MNINKQNEILSMFKNCSFENLSENNYQDQIINNLPKEILTTLRIEYGATKVVLIPEKEEYVIKIPFQYDEDYKFEGALETISELVDLDLDEEYDWDYCRVEEIISAQVNKLPIKKFFCQTHLLGRVNGYPIYIQEKADTFLEVKDFEDYSREKRTSTREICNKKGYSCFSEFWLSDLVDYCDSHDEQSFFDMFMTFIDDFDILDLHNGNIGYRKGVPVLIDYSGWNH